LGKAKALLKDGEQAVEHVASAVLVPHWPEDDVIVGLVHAQPPRAVIRV